jgi:serine/threonine-protein kinase HipA
VVDALRSKSLSFKADAQSLWRRIAFNHLVTNVDDHLHNLGFLYAGAGLWRLAPAFDLNPFPDQARESKTWLSEDSGPVTSVDQLMALVARFELDADAARAVLAQVVAAVGRWRDVALSPAVGMVGADLSSFAAAFEHPELARARRLAA